MRCRLLRWLCCPLCQGTLSLQVFLESQERMAPLLLDIHSGWGRRRTAMLLIPGINRGYARSRRDCCGVTVEPSIPCGAASRDSTQGPCETPPPRLQLVLLPSRLSPTTLHGDAPHGLGTAIPISGHIKPSAWDGPIILRVKRISSS